jgi:tetratricopeptide (TPR) repeat protein
VLHADAAALLDAARRALVAKRLPEARRQIEAVLALATPASLRAEALSLRADCAQVEGDRAAAIAAYSQVAQSFAALPAGENALFAAARLEQERGGRAAATAGLRRYLARYPRGRFVKEARQRLRALGVESSLEP